MNAKRKFNGLAAIVAGMTCLAAIAVAGTWAVLSANDRAPLPPAAAPLQTTPPAAELAVLRRERVAGDTPPELAVGISAMIAKADRAGARRALALPGATVYVLPAPDGRVCLASTNHAIGGCFAPPTREPSAAVVICSPFKPADELLLYGVVADGTSGLAARFADGSERAIPTDGNVFVLSVPRRDPLPTRLRWSDGRGGPEREIAAGVPADAGADECDTSLSPAQAEAQLAQRWEEHGDELRRLAANPPTEDPARP